MYERDGELSGEVLLIEKKEDSTRDTIRSILGTTIEYHDDWWRLYDHDPMLKRTVNGLLTLLAHYTDESHFRGWDNQRMDAEESQKARDLARQVFDAIESPDHQMPDRPQVEERLALARIDPSSDEGEFWFTHPTPHEVNHVMLVRKRQGEGYQDGRMKAFLLLLVQFTSGRRQSPYHGSESKLSVEEHMSGMDESGIHADMMIRLNGVGQALAFLLNSLSWRTYKAYDFDIQELRRKCGG